MVVMILENVSTALRGELSRWLLEPHSGVFVGHITARVRDKLWEKCCLGCKKGGVVQVWSTNTEQHYQVRIYGNTQRQVIECEGLQLIQIPQETDERRRVLALAHEET